MARIFVGNLPFDTHEGELKEMLEEYGVGKIDMPLDRETKRFRGFAFIDVNDDEKAILDLNEGTFGGRIIKVSKAEDRPPRRDQGQQGQHREFHKAVR